MVGPEAGGYSDEEQRAQRQVNIGYKMSCFQEKMEWHKERRMAAGMMRGWRRKNDQKNIWCII